MLGLTLFIFIFGLVWGSFLNVVIYRTTHGTSPLSGRSKCPKCKKTISWKYNIPLISFFWLQGKCAYCRAKISWQYPVVELLTGLLFVWWLWMGRGFFLLVGQPWTLLQPGFWLVVGMLLVVVFVADWRFGLIPDSVNFSLFVLALGYRLSLTGFGLMQSTDLIRAIICGLVLMAFFYGLWFFTRGRGFGFGDVKLAPALGLLLGWPKTTVAVFLAFVLGAVVALVLIALGKKKLGQTIPFGPFLVLGTFAALLFGNRLWGWYWGQL
ncbi:MAG: prepilin peptidase [Microgenomates group bacterium]